MKTKNNFQHGDQVEFRHGKVWMKGKVNSMRDAFFYPLQPNTIIILSEYGHFYEVEEKDVRKI